MDLVLLANGLSGISLDVQTLAVTAGILAIVYYVLFSQFGKRLGAALHDVMFTNWRLALLGLTGLVLSIASGWTTWDGMSNFTKEPVLSALVTFGIQGVMLIVAWLIGESFAVGMNHRPKATAAGPGTPALRALQPIASSIAGILLFSAIGILIYSAFSSGDPALNAQAAAAPWWSNWWDKLAIAAPAIVLVTLLIVNAGSDVLEDYTQSLRVMIRSAVLWLMFLACMATSVFFSFDSLFSTIFPASERQRAAELRAQNQVAGIVNDIASLAATRRLTEQEALFQSAEWKRYDDTLETLAGRARGVDSKLQAYMEQKLRERQSELNRFQEDRSSAESQQVSLVRRKGTLNTEISRLKEQVSGLAPEVARLTGLVFEKDRELIAKKAEVEGEAGGIGVTSKIGRGPKYREIKTQFDRLSEEKRNLELQLREFQSRLDAARQKLNQSETELAQNDGEIAKLKSRSDTAGRMINARTAKVADNPSFDATTGVAQLTKARDTFRREPTAQGLGQIQTICGAMVGAMQSTDALKGQANGINCDPEAASETAARVFALNAGIVALKARCIGGDKLPSSGGADALYGFARGCVQDAGLPGRDTDVLRKRINSVELARDDKAHRFVVTTNAFEDGNKLAYLALGIAIAIDALVFMSGLFGANAVRSPLSDVPSYKGRSARQLEDVIENALLPDKFENAMFALDAIHPISRAAPPALGSGWTHEAVMENSDYGSKLRVLKVLNAGATIGAVRRDEKDLARYFIRSELLEFLNQVAKRAFEKDKDKVKLSELRKIVTVALQPYVSDHADIVLGHMHPISDKSGFTSEIYMSDVPAEDVPIVQRSLNAGSTLDYVQRDSRREERDRFYVHKEFYRTLAMISADNPKFGRRQTFGQQQLMPPATAMAVDGGRLEEAELLRLGVQKAAHSARQAATGDDHATAVTPPNGSKSARDETPEDAQRRFRRALISALKIDPASYDLVVGDVQAAAMDAERAFEGLRHSRPALKRLLDSRDQQAQDHIDKAHRGLEAEISNTSTQAKLNDAMVEIMQNWGVIMMLPNGPYERLFGQIIAKLAEDDGNGVLAPQDGDLLGNLKLLRDAFRASPRGSQDDWHQLTDNLRRATKSDGKADLRVIQGQGGA